MSSERLLLAIRLLRNHARLLRNGLPKRLWDTEQEVSILQAPILPATPDEFSPLSALSTCGASSGSSDRRTVGYYESWSYSKSCGWKPEDLYPQLLTHLNFAFALVGADNRIASMGPNDIELYRRTTALKSQNPALKVFISVGGWDAGAQGFSRMASSAGNRATFISSVVAFMNTYAFDGIDIDWEYPVADDRGGVPADKANYVLCRFLQNPLVRFPTRRR